MRSNDVGTEYVGNKCVAELDLEVHIPKYISSTYYPIDELDKELGNRDKEWPLFKASCYCSMALQAAFDLPVPTITLCGFLIHRV